MRRDLDGVLARCLDGHRLSAPVGIEGDPATQERSARIVGGHKAGSECPEQRAGHKDRHEQGDDPRTDPTVA